jgi:nucleoside phosphorylase
MTRTAIIAAMPGELKPLTRRWQHERRDGVDLWRWQFDEGVWIAACAGAGVDAAIRALAEAESDGPLDRVISTGWAGALSPEYLPGHAFDVSVVVDARTGERLLTDTPFSLALVNRVELPDLKGHGFSRATEAATHGPALAAEGKLGAESTRPQGLKPNNLLTRLAARLKPSPFKAPPDGELSTASSTHPVPVGCCLVTSAKVADEREKRRLAGTYRGALVDMEAAGVARVAAIRRIPFYCIKGVSDGFADKLPDFNRFILPNGKFQLARFVLFAVLRPRHWPALVRMGENSSKASRSIAESLLDFLDPQGTIRERNGYPDFKR